MFRTGVVWRGVWLLCGEMQVRLLRLRAAADWQYIVLAHR